MSDTPPQADTIVLIHGLWMTPGSWEQWIERYVRRGFDVIAPAWPGEDDEFDQPPRDAPSFSRSDVAEVVGHHERIVRDLAKPPIIMGHSFGGVFVHLLLDRGLGCAGVAMDSGRDALNRHKVIGAIPKRFHRAVKLRSGGAFAKSTPRPDLRVESRRHGRAPLLFIAGDGERTVLGQDGWEQVADYALGWATDNAVRSERTPALEPR